MKTTWTSGFFVVCALAGVMLCCKNDDTVTTPQEQPYVPLITNSWTDVANQNHSFFFGAARESVSMGTFTGRESYIDSIQTFPLTGNFMNRNIGFTVTRRGRDTAYAGRFVTDTLIDFNGIKLFRH